MRLLPRPLRLASAAYRHLQDWALDGGRLLVVPPGPSRGSVSRGNARGTSPAPQPGSYKVLGSMSGPVTTKWSRTRRKVRTVTHSTFRRSPEDLRLGQIELRLQNRPLIFGLRSRRKGFAYAPQRMAIQDVPLK